PRGLHRVLCRPDRGRGAGGSSARVPVLRDVDTEPDLRSRRARGIVARAQAGQLAARSRLGRRGLCRGEMGRVAPSPEGRGGRRGRRMSTLDRYVPRAWAKVFRLTALRFPFLVMGLDPADKLDLYLGRGFSQQTVG